jgi:hypothetical protein
MAPRVHTVLEFQPGLTQCKIMIPESADGPLFPLKWP